MALFETYFSINDEAVEIPWQSYGITGGKACFSLTLIQLYTLQLSQGMGPSCEVYIGWYLLCKPNKGRIFIRAAYGIWLNCVVKFQVKPAVAEIEFPPGKI